MFKSVQRPHSLVIFCPNGEFLSFTVAGTKKCDQLWGNVA